MTTELAEKKAYEWKDTFDGKLGHLASMSLAENLSISYPNDEKREPSQETVDSLLREIAQECKERRKRVGIACDGSLSEEAFLNRVKDDAFRLWKTNSTNLPVLKTACPQKSSQFSLLFGGSALGSFMSWERLQEESDGSTEKMIQMLLNLEHLQDILLDWDDHLAPFFLQGLRNEFTFSSRDFYDLHKSWFNKSRTSNEFRTMQIGLCQNLVAVVNEQLSVGNELSTESSKKIRDVVELALLMFEDWMLRGLYVHDKRVQSIGESIWNWLEIDSNGGMSVAGQSVVAVDSDATWFTSWNAHLSPDQCLAIVSSDESTSILANAIHWCDSYAAKTDATVPVDSADHRLFFFWVTILHSILESTRASRFPWEKMLEAKSLEQKKIIIVNLYLNLMKIEKMDSAGYQNSFAMSGDAIETILLVEKGGIGPARKAVSVFLENISSDENISADKKLSIQAILQKVLGQAL